MQDSFRLCGVLVLTGILAALTGSVSAQAPGDAPPQATQDALKPLIRELGAAMNARDAAAIEQVVQRVRTLLGPFAGVPESPERYQWPAERGTPEAVALRRAWDAAFSTVLARAGSKSAAPAQMELREPAYVALMLAAAVDAWPDARDRYVARLEEELAFLMPLQGESGIFPYPVEPDERAPENVRRDTARMRQQFPEKIKNGYLYIDDGGMQFDTACVGVALCEGFRLTGERRYLEAAKRAAAWATALPLSNNWNYNAFSAWLLASVYRYTGEPVHLEAALEKTRYGVLPGLMESGRWVDQHNAKQTYHFIIVRALSELLDVLPADHADHAALKERLDLAVDARVEDILRDGISNVESAFWGLSQAVYRQGPQSRRGEALDLIAQLILEQPSGFYPALLPLYARLGKETGGVEVRAVNGVD
ncbi:MAG: hypothetical protein HYV27_03205 [Candidatus Hydrogenedentes bacterium]|nr:hypothetical protein [Candidatus Hydrogenedentota bacterium]